MNTPDSELRRLTDAWHDGTITPEQALRLEQRLLADAADRDYFFDITAIDVAMAGALAQLPQKAPVVRRTVLHSLWRIAAVFVIGCFCGALLFKSLPSKPIPQTAAKPPAAMVTGMLGVNWDGQPEERSVGLAAGLTESKISTGLLELTFASGTRAVIEGPAAFRVLGDNSMTLTRGKLVADVPKGAEGFTVAYADGRIVDLGTEFGVEVAENGRSANFGVFRGEIEYHRPDDAAPPVKLLENHAILATNGTVVSVPFEQEKFTRKLPSREFVWNFQGANTGSMVLNYDISHLIWNAGRYRAICKWMVGHHIEISGVEILRDGKPVAADSHAGLAGDILVTHDNSFDLIIPPGAYQRGHWTLRIRTNVNLELGTTVDSAGVILMESGLALDAKPEDFIGTWEYLHDGKVYRRSFLADGTAALTIDGAIYVHFSDSHWKIESGCLVLDVKNCDGSRQVERHLLPNPRTLVFTNQPYRNATRVAE